MTKNKLIIFLCSIFVILVLVVISFFWDNTPNDVNNDFPIGDEEQNRFPELEIYTTTEDDGWVIVSTSYGDFRYPYAFSDIMSVKAVNQEDSSQLGFFFQIEDIEEMIYTIHYNNEIGVSLGNLTLKNYSESIPVFVEFGQPSEIIQKDFLDSFYATRDTFNDVVTFMCENESFTFIK